MTSDTPARRECDVTTVTFGVVTNADGCPVRWATSNEEELT